MGQLVSSTNPILWLAGIIFLIGACFDAVFSVKLKRAIADTLSSDYRSGAAPLLSRSAVYFADDILSPSRPMLFAVKTIILSISFYCVASVLEVVRYPDSLAADIHSQLARSIGVFYFPVIILIMINATFDVLSAYISVLYLRLAGIMSKSGYIFLILASDIIVTIFLWAVFFPAAVSAHVWLADLNTRAGVIGIKAEPRERIEWSSTDNPILTNPTTRETGAARITVFEGSEKEGKFRKARNTDGFIVVTNIGQMDRLSSAVLDLPEFFLNDMVEAVSGKKMIDGFATRAFWVSRVLNIGDYMSSLDDHLGILSPVRLLFGESGLYYVTTATTYGPILEDFTDHLSWRGDVVHTWCDGKAVAATWREVGAKDFSECNEFMIAPEGAARYLALVVGQDFGINTGFSYKAFFWSSLAVTMSFYVVVLVIAGKRKIVAEIGRYISAGWLKADKLLFTFFGTLVSIALLAAYGASVVASWVAA